METKNIKGHTPNAVKKIGNKELHGLIRFLDGSGKTYFQGFAEKAVEKVKDNFVKRRPTGNNGMDSHQWGYYQGLLEAHQLYANLLEHLELEKKLRDQENATEDN